MSKSKKSDLLKLHNHNIYQRESDGYWVTRVGTEKPYKRIVRKEYSDLEKYLVAYYKDKTKCDVTFAECILLWLRSEENAPNPAIGHKTITNYYAEYKRFLQEQKFSKKKMVNITAEDVQDVLNTIVNQERKIERKRFNSVKTVITNVFDYARSELHLKVIPIRQVVHEIVFKANKFAVPKEKQQVFYQDDLEAFIHFLLSENSFSSLGILLTAQTGLRISEICALSWEDVHEHYLHIHNAEHSWTTLDGERHVEIALPKEDKIRDVILSMEAKHILSLIRDIQPVQQGFIFLNTYGERMTARCFDYDIRKYCAQCNIPVLSMHKLRKTYTSVLLATGYAEKVVQEQLGHADITTTQKHYNYNPYRKEEQFALFCNANVVIPKVTTSDHPACGQ